MRLLTWLDASTDHLELTARTERIVREAGFKTIGELIERRKELDSVAGFGRKSAEELDCALRSPGLSEPAPADVFGEKLPTIPVSSSEMQHYCSLQSDKERDEFLRSIRP